VAKARWLLVLLVGGALAVAITLLTGDPVPVETVQELEPEDLQLLSFDPQTASAILIQHQDGSQLHLRRRPVPAAMAGDDAGTAVSPRAAHDDGIPAALDNGSGLLAEWELAAPEPARVNSRLVSEAVLALSDLRAYRRVESQDEIIEAADFGLDPPRARLEIRLEPAKDLGLEQGLEQDLELNLTQDPDPAQVTEQELDQDQSALDLQVLTLWIGQPTPVMVGDHPTYYVQVPGQEGVFAAGGPGLALVDAAPEDLMPAPDLLDGDVPAQGHVHD